jgi:hypothetical protein
MTLVTESAQSEGPTIEFVFGARHIELIVPGDTLMWLGSVQLHEPSLGFDVGQHPDRVSSASGEREVEEGNALGTWIGCAPSLVFLDYLKIFAGRLLVLV